MPRFFPLVLLAGCALEGPTPSLASLSPALICDEAGLVTLTLEGEGFGLTVADVATREPRLQPPQVALLRVGDETGAPDEEVGASVQLPDEAVAQLGPGTLTLAIDPALGLKAGTYDVLLTNPDGQASTLPAALVATDPPEVLELVPGALCNGSESNIILAQGSGFLTVEGALPTATVDGLPVTVLGVEDCLPLAAGIDGEICTGLLLEIDGGAYALGAHALQVTNPEPAACSSSSAPPLEVVLPPTLSAIDPAQVCSDGGEITLTGEHFSEWTEVTVGGVPATVTYINDTTLIAALGESTPTGMQDVTVGLNGACEDTLEAALEVVSAPDVVFVDPPVTYSPIEVTVTVYVADISSTISEVWLEDSAGVRTDLAFVWDENNPATLQATVPAGLANGSYTVALAQDDGCGAGLDGGLEVSDTLTIAVEDIEPAYAWTWTYTPVELNATSPAPTGQVDLQDTPIIYLAPQAGGAGTAVGAVRWKDGGSASAVIPALLAVGVYDVLVINPDGSLGLLEGGLEITEEPPPTITSVSPPSLENNGDGAITIYGEDFRSPKVELDCVENGASVTATVSVDSSTETRIQATVDMGSLSAAVCVVSVTNSDNTKARWSALTIRNPSQNLFPWNSGPDLVVARRAPAGAAGRTTSVDRYVYAIGGDSGDGTTPLASMEVASLDPWGELGDFSLMEQVLPSARTLAMSARVRNFVYIIGGDEGSGAVNTGWRALILDPLDVPHLDSLGVDSLETGGLSAGGWTYRVAALYGPDDLSNPSGEGLPGDPIRVRLPADGYSVTVGWTEIEGAVGYRVYRSPTANSGSGQEEWLADVSDVLFYTDTGSATDSTQTPLTPGALGEWVALPKLRTARSGACIAVVEDPGTDPDLVYLFVAGGEGSTGSDLSSVERLDITVVNDSLVTESAWKDAGVSLSKARRLCGGYAATNELHPSIDSGAAWIWFGGGISGSKATGVVDAGEVLSDGSISGWADISGDMTPARAGFATAAASDFLYAFGGKNGAADAGGVSAELESDQVPEVQNWNSLGTSMSEARLLPGSAQESAVIVIFGGETESSAATTSTDWTNW